LRVGKEIIISTLDVKEEKQQQNYVL